MGLNFDTHGIRETLSELRRYEPELYKELVQNLIQSAQPAAKAVGSEFPNMPLRNWHSSGGRKGASRFPPYNGTAAKTKVKPVISIAQPRGVGVHKLVRLQQSDGGAQVFDSAGSASAGRLGRGSSSSQRFIANLDKRSNIKSNGKRYRSRVMLWATEKHLPLIEAAVEAEIAKINKQTQKRLSE
jgi:hypothetical protein